MSGWLHFPQKLSRVFTRDTMPLRSSFPSFLLPLIVLTIGLGFTLPASGTVSAFGPAPSGEGCTLTFSSPNSFSCSGSCSTGEECSAEALVIQRIDGGLIFECGNDCPETECYTKWEMDPGGVLRTGCRNVSCTSCAADMNTKICGCASQ